MAQWRLQSERVFDVSELPLLASAAAQLVAELTVPSFILLSGNLGSGKTQLVKDIVNAADGEPATSPSFSLHNVYESRLGRIHHFDLYRLESEEEIETSGLWDTFQDPSIVIIEWAERLRETDLPRDWSHWHIEISQSEKRTLRWRIYAAAD